MNFQQKCEIVLRDVHKEKKLIGVVPFTVWVNENWEILIDELVKGGK